MDFFQFIFNIPKLLFFFQILSERCPSLLMSANGRVIKERTNIKTPVMMMIGSEDYVLGAEGGEACRQYSLNSLICIDSFYLVK